MSKKSIKSFEDLKAWKKSRKLRKDISVLVKDFPKKEQYRLIDQLIRSSRSAPANIAEGYGRFHYQENIQFCRQARGSLYEVIEHLICAFDEEYINENELHKLKNDVTQCVRLLNGFISYLKKAKQNKSVHESETLYQADPPNNQ